MSRKYNWPLIFFPMAQQPLVGQGLLIIEASRSHSDTPHSVGLVRTSDRPDAETSTWQYTTLTRDRHPCPAGIQTRNPSKRAAADPRLSPRGHWDRHTPIILIFLFLCVSSYSPTFFLFLSYLPNTEKSHQHPDGPHPRDEQDASQM
jgi:hypothetical protein